jgi:NAD(P)-dependent dehydrogenase (short-subunit alcohol dehydrogenase family)
VFSVEGKRVLVRGGTSGIGRMIARAFVENGASVLYVLGKVLLVRLAGRTNPTAMLA